MDRLGMILNEFDAAVLDMKINFLVIKKLYEELYNFSINCGRLNLREIEVLSRCSVKYVECVSNYLEKSDLSKRKQFIVSQHLKIVWVLSRITGIKEPYMHYVFIPLIEKITAPDVKIVFGKEIATNLFCVIKDSNCDYRNNMAKKNYMHFCKLIDTLSTCGDFEYQVILLKIIIYMFAETDLKLNSKSMFPESSTLAKQLCSITFNNFYHDARQFLNIFNEKSKIIYSYKLERAVLDSYKIQPPKDELWVDFNTGLETISMYCDRKCLTSQEISQGETELEVLIIDFNDVDTVLISHLMDADSPRSPGSIILFNLNGPCSVIHESSQKAANSSKLKFAILNSEKLVQLETEVLPWLFGRRLQEKTLSPNQVPESKSESLKTLPLNSRKSYGRILNVDTSSVSDALSLKSKLKAFEKVEYPVIEKRVSKSPVIKNIEDFYATSTSTDIEEKKEGRKEPLNGHIDTSLQETSRLSLTDVQEMKKVMSKSKKTEPVGNDYILHSRKSDSESNTSISVLESLGNFEEKCLEPREKIDPQLSRCHKLGTEELNNDKTIDSISNTSISVLERLDNFQEKCLEPREKIELKSSRCRKLGTEELNNDKTIDSISNTSISVLESLDDLEEKCLEPHEKIYLKSSKCQKLGSEELGNDKTIDSINLQSCKDGQSIDLLSYHSLSGIAEVPRSDRSLHLFVNKNDRFCGSRAIFKIDSGNYKYDHCIEALSCHSSSDITEIICIDNSSDEDFSNSCEKAQGEIDCDNYTLKNASSGLDNIRKPKTNNVHPIVVKEDKEFLHFLNSMEREYDLSDKIEQKVIECNDNTVPSIYAYDNDEDSNVTNLQSVPSVVNQRDVDNCFTNLNLSPLNDSFQSPILHKAKQTSTKTTNLVTKFDERNLSNLIPIDDITSTGGNKISSPSSLEVYQVINNQDVDLQIDAEKDELNKNVIEEENTCFEEDENTEHVNVQQFVDDAVEIYSNEQVQEAGGITSDNAVVDVHKDNEGTNLKQYKRTKKRKVDDFVEKYNNKDFTDLLIADENKHNQKSPERILKDNTCEDNTVGLDEGSNFVQKLSIAISNSPTDVDEHSLPIKKRRVNKSPQMYEVQVENLLPLKELDEAIQKEVDTIVHNVPCEMKIGNIDQNEIQEKKRNKKFKKHLLSTRKRIIARQSVTLGNKKRRQSVTPSNSDKVIILQNLTDEPLKMETTINEDLTENEKLQMDAMRRGKHVEVRIGLESQDAVKFYMDNLNKENCISCNSPIIHRSDHNITPLRSETEDLLSFSSNKEKNKILDESKGAISPTDHCSVKSQRSTIVKRKVKTVRNLSSGSDISTFTRASSTHSGKRVKRSSIRRLYNPDTTTSINIMTENIPEEEPNHCSFAEKSLVNQILRPADNHTEPIDVMINDNGIKETEGLDPSVGRHSIVESSLPIVTVMEQSTEIDAEGAAPGIKQCPDKQKIICVLPPITSSPKPSNNLKTRNLLTKKKNINVLQNILIKSYPQSKKKLSTKQQQIQIYNYVDRQKRPEINHNIHQQISSFNYKSVDDHMNDVLCNTKFITTLQQLRNAIMRDTASFDSPKKYKSKTRKSFQKSKYPKLKTVQDMSSFGDTNYEQDFAALLKKYSEICNIVDNFINILQKGMDDESKEKLKRLQDVVLDQHIKMYNKLLQVNPSIKVQNPLRNKSKELKHLIALCKSIRGSKSKE